MEMAELKQGLEESQKDSAKGRREIAKLQEVLDMKLQIVQMREKEILLLKKEIDQRGGRGVGKSSLDGWLPDKNTTVGSAVGAAIGTCFVHSIFWYMTQG